MSDSYLGIAAIANDEIMIQRLMACATQQAHLGGTILSIGGSNGSDPRDWVTINAYLWASSPGWGQAWDYSLSFHTEVGYEPGKDPLVITDEMILTAVQSLTAE